MKKKKLGFEREWRGRREKENMCLGTGSEKERKEEENKIRDWNVSVAICNTTC